MSLRSVLIEEAAQLLGVSRRTVYYRIRAGRLRTVRTRGRTQRVTIESIEEVLRRERGPASAEPGESEAEALPLEV